jgi:ABC-2 type transport system permease protein
MIQVFLRFKALAIRVALEYRANFWLMVGSGILMRGVFILIVMVIYHNIPAVAGWKEAEMFLIIGLLLSAEGISNVFCDGPWHLGEHIYRGTLDVMLARPISPLFQVLCYGMGLQGFGIFPLGLGISVWSMAALGYLTPLYIACALIAVICGVVLRVASTFLFASTLFYFKGANLNIPFLAHTIGEFGRYPVSIYPFWMRIILLYIIPTGFIGYIPALIMRESRPLMILVIPAMTAVYALAVRFVFYRGIRHYESMGM